MGESKRRKENDSNYGKNIEKPYVSFSGLSFSKLIEKYGLFTQHYVWNNNIYANDLDTDLYYIKPYKESSKYTRFKDLLDAVAEDLKNKPNGKWIFFPELSWLKESLPFSLMEIYAIAKYDNSITKIIDLNTPSLPQIPNYKFNYYI